MEASDIKKYDACLELYSEIMGNRGKTRTISEIRECLETFEVLEDYDKCKDLLDIIRIEFNNKNANK